MMRCACIVRTTPGWKPRTVKNRIVPAGENKFDRNHCGGLQAPPKALLDWAVAMRAFTVQI